MKLLRLLAICCAVFSVMAVVAQERTASQPFTGRTDVTSPALVQKISYLSQVNRVLEAQLNACRNGEPMPEASEVTTEDNGDFASKAGGYGAAAEPDDQDASMNTRTRIHYSNNNAAPRRTTGVYQQATSESKLTCDDYSISYFSRHPAMAAVCNMTQRVQQPAPTAPAVAPVAPVSASTSVSASSSVRARILGVSATAPAAR